jgi:hypothetical protein
MQDNLRQQAAQAEELLASKGRDLRFAAVDFETFYRSEKSAARTGKKACSVIDSGNWAYCRHPDWHAFLVSIFSPACGIDYVGPVESAPWERIAGFTWLSHNRNFDRHVYERLHELGKVPAPAWSVWHDTADLAVYSHLPRSLKNAVAANFGLKLDKDTRTLMDGKSWTDLSPDQQERMRLYAIDDAIACWLLWATFESRWPDHERQASLQTGEIEFRGIPVDLAAVQTDIAVLETAKWHAQNAIPWYNAEDKDGDAIAIGSRNALNEECLKHGVTPPTTTARKSKEFLDWLDKFGARVPAVIELNRYRRIDRMLSVYRSLLARVRPDGRAAIGLKYGGAERTLRWSGTSGFNLQNIGKTPFYFDAEGRWLEPGSVTQAAMTVDLRSRFVASEGRKLIIADLSQIEPRILNWFVQNKRFLELCSAGMSPYEAHARASMGWSGGNLKKEDPVMYALAKARVLALGYGAGWAKFIEMARGYLPSEKEFLAIFGVTPSDEETEDFLRYLRWLSEDLQHKSATKSLIAWRELDDRTRNIWVNSWLQVQSFRRSNPNICRLWSVLDEALRGSEEDGILEVPLVSGRSLKYFQVTSALGWQSVPGNIFNTPQRTYGGLLAENMVQAIARDCFLHGLLNLERAGFRVLFHVHDEVVVDAPMDARPEQVVAELTRLPSWADQLPVAAEAEESTHYKK